MKSKDELINDIKNIAIKSVSDPKLLEFSLDKGLELASYYNANPDIVYIGICFMDIKLKEALSLNKQPEHIKMAVEFAKEFMKDYDISNDYKDDIINCIEAHHKTVPFKCLEAEICANADCYIFIHPIGVFNYMGLLNRRGKSLSEQVVQLQSKMKEKHNIISLDKAKEDLEDNYQMFMKLFGEI